MNVLKEINKIAEGIKTANKRQVIQDTIDKITIEDRREVEIWGSLSFPALNMAYGSINRNTQFQIPLLQFKFIFVPHRPRKERIIAERDEMGRIVSSKVPEILVL